MNAVHRKERPVRAPDPPSQRRPQDEWPLRRTFWFVLVSSFLAWIAIFFACALLL